jgi:hypothetical protein
MVFKNENSTHLQRKFYSEFADQIHDMGDWFYSMFTGPYSKATHSSPKAPGLGARD